MKTNRNCLTRIFIALIVTVCYNSLQAQKAQGLYMLASDFISHKLSFSTNEHTHCKIKLHNLSIRSNIKITRGDSVFQFSKDSVYGFKDHEGISHRFFNKTVYAIINPDETILLYRVLAAGKTKYEAETYGYYFSKDAASPVLPLRMGELERSFSDNNVFVDFLEVHFKNDGELLEFDQNHKMYKLNHLLQLSKIKNN